MDFAHGIYVPYTWGVDIGGVGPETYVVSLPLVIKSVDCLVKISLARAHNMGRLRENFMYQYWKANIAILQEGLTPLPWCDHCDMHMPSARLYRHK